MPKVRKAVLAAAVICLLVLIVSGARVYQDREQIGARFAAYLSDRMQNVFGLRVTLSKLEGIPTGYFKITELKAVSEADPEKRLVFSCEEVEFRYDWLDFLQSRFRGKVDIRLKRPIFYADVPFSVRSSNNTSTPTLFKKLVRKARRKIHVIIEDGKIAWLGREGEISGIEGHIQNGGFNLQIGLDHLSIGGQDYSTQIHLEGALSQDVEDAERLDGSLFTQGTVVNWEPIEEETHIAFHVTPKALVIHEGTVLSGISLQGQIQFLQEEMLDLTVKARDYDLRMLNPLIRLRSGKTLSGILDLDLHAHGSPQQIGLNGHVLLKNSKMARRPFKNLQLTFRGIYPEVRISESRVVLEDGTVMRLASGQVLVKELFSSSTYERLIGVETQDDVLWGDWRLMRKDEGPKDGTMSLERDVGQSLKIRYESPERSEVDLLSDDKKDEMDFEYQLTEQDSMKLKLKEDEGFVGVQKKVQW